MSIQVLAKKTRAKRGLSHNRNFAKFVTGERNKMGGCCRATNIPGPGLRRGLRQGQYRCCPPDGGPPSTFPGGVVRPKVPINQMGYGIYLKSRQGRGTGRSGPGLLAGRLVGNYVGVKNQSSSLHLEKKKVNILKTPACCSDTNVIMDNLGLISSGQTQFYAGCTYIIYFETPGSVLSIDGVTIEQGATKYSLSICKCGIKEVSVVTNEGAYIIPVVTPPSNSRRACGSSSCSCTKTFNYPRLEGGGVRRKGDCCGPIPSLKKQRPAYTRGNSTCCVTTKDLTCKTSSDYTMLLKGRRSCYCRDPALKKVCGGGGC